MITPNMELLKSKSDKIYYGSACENLQSTDESSQRRPKSIGRYFLLRDGKVQSGKDLSSSQLNNIESTDFQLNSQKPW